MFKILLNYAILLYVIYLDRNMNILIKIHQNKIIRPFGGRTNDSCFNRGRHVSGIPDSLHFFGDVGHVFRGAGGDALSLGNQL